MDKSLFLICVFLMDFGLSVGLSASAEAQTCVDLLSKQTSNIVGLNAAQSYTDFRRSRLWNHPNEDFNKVNIEAFAKNNWGQNSADNLWAVFSNLQANEKAVETLDRVLRVLGDQLFSPEQKKAEIFKLAEDLKALENGRTALDLKSFFPEQMQKFYLFDTTSLRSVRDIRARIQWLQREQETLTMLFQSLAKFPGPDLKTKRFVDESTLHLKPKPEKITLLVFMIRRQYLDLFEALVNSSEVKTQLHLDYSVLLLDEVEELPSNVRAPYRRLVNQTFSPEAQTEYNKGKRGVNTTMWDRIPIGAY